MAARPELEVIDMPDTVVNAVVMSPQEEEDLMQDHFDTTSYDEVERPEDQFPDVTYPEGQE